MMFDLSGKTAFVSGSSAGIGRAVAEHLLENNCRVILNSRYLERITAVKNSLPREWQERVLLIPFDVANKDQVVARFEQHRQIFENIDFLINNAGVYKTSGPFYNNTLESIDATLQVNIQGSFYLTRLVLPAMMQKNSGHIVNLGSVSGRWTHKGSTVYCASKFAIRSFTEGLRLDLMGTNIRVTNIEPGLTESEMVQRENYGNADIMVSRDIAEAIVWSLARPPHVNIQEMVIFSRAQAGVGFLHADLNKSGK